MSEACCYVIHSADFPSNAANIVNHSNSCQTVKYMLDTTGGAGAALALLGRTLGRAAHQESQHACWSI